MNWLKAWLAVSFRSQMFMVNDGNDDKADLIDPAKYGLENTVNVYFPTLDPRANPEDKVAGWFIKPLSERNTVSQVKDNSDGQTCDSKKQDCGILETGKLTKDDTVFILLHGNAKNRGASHRIAAYKVWQRLGYHVLTIDYRGFGDSVMNGTIGETTLVEDSKAAIKLIRDAVGTDPKLIVYGHSMGTGVAPRAVAELHKEGLARVDGVILDSPFHSLNEMFESSYMFSAADYLLDFRGIMDSIDVHFETPKWVRSLDVPVRIFHAVVDPVCPLYGAKKLVEDVKKSGKDDIDIVIWEEEGLGHIGISTTESFPKEIKRFADSVRPKKKL